MDKNNHKKKIIVVFDKYLHKNKQSSQQNKYKKRKMKKYEYQFMYSDYYKKRAFVS